MQVPTLQISYLINPCLRFWVEVFFLSTIFRIDAEEEEESLLNSYTTPSKVSLCLDMAF